MNLLVELARVARFDFEVGVDGTSGQAVVFVLGDILATFLEVEAHVTVCEVAGFCGPWKDGCAGERDEGEYGEEDVHLD